MHLDKYIKQIQEAEGDEKKITKILNAVIKERDDEHHWRDWDFGS